ncbi:MAG: hypothetical protein ACR2KX_16015 [Chitinophagaceae bacterium]
MVVVILIIAAFTKPNDKTIMEQTVKAVWGDLTPRKYKFPEYYEQFMDINSQNVDIDDWLIVKRIQYTFGNDKKTIGYAAFGKVMIDK